MVNRIKGSIKGVHFLPLQKIVGILRFISEHPTEKQINKFLFDSGLSPSKQTNLRLLTTIINTKLVVKLETQYKITEIGKYFISENAKDLPEIYHLLCYKHLIYYQHFINAAFDLLYSAKNGNLALGKNLLIQDVNNLIVPKLGQDIPHDKNLEYFSGNCLKILFQYLYPKDEPRQNRHFKIEDLTFKDAISEKILLFFLRELKDCQKNEIVIMKSDIDNISKPLFLERSFLISLFDNISPIYVNFNQSDTISLNLNSLGSIK